MTEFLTRLRFLLFRKRRDELDEELRFHLEQSIAAKMAAGLTAEEARRQALIDFGGVERAREQCEQERPGLWIDTLLRDVRYSLRILRKSPWFTATVVVTLALGIGANTAIFSVVNAVLLKSLTYPDADRLVNFLRPSAVIANNLHDILEFHFFERQTKIFKEVVAFDAAGPGYNLTGGHPEQVHGIHVTEGYFRVYGAPVLLGRTFTPQEDSPNGGKVVVLSYGLWQRRFGGNPAIVGKSLSLGNEAYTVVGVIGKDFVADPQADLWLPFQFDPVSTDMNHFFYTTGVLQPGVTVAQANAELLAASPGFHREYPILVPQRFTVGPLRDSIIGDARNSLLMMLGAVGLVLLICCANVANLLLVRASVRKREFAVRSALGASRARIVRQLLTESVLLSIAGGILGMALGFAGVRALLALSPVELPRVGEGGSAVVLDWRVLVFTLAVSLLTGILFGLFPAFSALRSDLNFALRESGNRSGIGIHQEKTRSLLVISEVSLALVLLIGSALLIRTFIVLHGVDPGFDPRNVLTMEMSLNGPRYQTAAGVSELLKNGRDRLNALPGVEVAAAGYWLPVDIEDAAAFQIAGRPVRRDCCGSKWMSISPGYLSVFRISVLRGRDFNENDNATAPPVVLINEAFARKFFPNKDPLGQQIRHWGRDETIIGIAPDIHDNGLDMPADALIIAPIAQVSDSYTAATSNIQPLIWLVRTHGDPHQYLSAITEQLRIASDGFPVAHVRTMDEVMGYSTARQSFNMLLLSIFGAVALALAAVGIYGLMAYSVAQRTQEMGIRMALGADRSVIRKFVVWQGMRLVLVGVAAGVVASFGLTRLLSNFLFGVKPWDPAVFTSAPLILVAIALFAVWLPAARASKIDPMQALRME